MASSLVATIQNIKITYNSKEVLAKKLTVKSVLNLNIEDAWANVQKSALLVYVAKGKVKFQPVSKSFPLVWKEGSKVETKMSVFGFLPFGGVHTLFFEKIDAANYTLQTKEWDSAAKVWNHKISLEKIDDSSISYTDEIIIYGGILTNFITTWAKSFYIHRQKRWLLVASNNLKF